MKQRDFLQAQKIEMDRMLLMSEDDLLTTFALEQRRDDAEIRLKSLPLRTSEPRAVLFFTGEPVYGSQGIDAQFAIGVIGPFLEMVKTQYAASKHGQVGMRGRLRDQAEARLMLTGFPRGSFGIELSRPDSNDIGNEQLSETLVHITDVIRSAAQDDETFVVALEKVSHRVLSRLREFFKAISDGDAGVKLVSGDLECRLDKGQVHQAVERVNSAESKEELIEEEGVFRGATLDSWRFDFRTIAGESISGRLDDSVDETQATADMLGLINKPSKAQLRRISVRTRSGILRITYELLSLVPLPLLNLPEQ